MTIKHLVLGGGGAAGFTIYGALKKLNTNNFFDFLFRYILLAY